MKPGDRVLDVCCGTGDQATQLAGMGIDAYGIDLDPGMIAVAEGKRKRYGKDNLHFQVADATALPFENGFFDYATISLALHEKPAEVQEKVIAEMRRVTRKGGKLILADFSIPARWLFRLDEMLVGGEHYANFRAYQASGGLDHLVVSSKLNVEKRGGVLGGGVVLLKLRN
jgi:ubiquinone/menaquinone biosynthesis C-methylase UbiE